MDLFACLERTVHGEGFKSTGGFGLGVGRE
jgi:hypothetical protein